MKTEPLAALYFLCFSFFFVGLQAAAGPDRRPVKTFPAAARRIAPPRLPRPPIRPKRPFPQHVDYAPGTIKPDHLSQARLDDDVRALYDAWKSRYLVQAGCEPDGHPRYRVRMGRGAQDATVSEGQGYGMVLAAYMAGYDKKARVLFDGLWEFALDQYASIRPLSSAERELTHALDLANLIISCLNWLRWLVVQQRKFEDPNQANARIARLWNRLLPKLGYRSGD